MKFICVYGHGKETEVCTVVVDFSMLVLISVVLAILLVRHVDVMTKRNLG